MHASQSHTPTPLTQKERKDLRGAAQRLHPALTVGTSGITENTLAEIARAFAKAPLIKVRFSGDREIVKQHIAALETATTATCVGSVGFTASFYKPVAAAAVGSTLTGGS